MKYIMYSYALLVGLVVFAADNNDMFTGLTNAVGSYPTTTKAEFTEYILSIQGKQRAQYVFNTLSDKQIYSLSEACAVIKKAEEKFPEEHDCAVYTVKMTPRIYHFIQYSKPDGSSCKLDLLDPLSFNQLSDDQGFNQFVFKQVNAKISSATEENFSMDLAQLQEQYTMLQKK